MNRVNAVLLCVLFACATEAHGQSFDCRAATLSIERAICGDPTLSEWDARMGQQYQQALRGRRSTETQALIDQQRLWIQHRNAACGVVPGNALWSCLLDMTKQRLAALAAVPPVSAMPQQPPSPPPPPPTYVQAPPKTQNAPSQGPPSNAQTASTPQTAPASIAPSTTASDGSGLLLVILFVVAAVVGAVFVVNSIARRERRQRLVAKYGEQVAEMIIAHQIWQGMTEEQLVESLGAPVDRDYEVKKTRTKETWKYGQTGRNRFSNRVYLENGVVIGWKQ
jgi:uncharacterized protein